MMADLPNALPATNEDTSGPYFPIYFEDPALQDLTRVHPGVVGQAEGSAIILRGRVFDRHGDLAHGAILEFWQANAKGIYRTPASEGHPDIDPILTAVRDDAPKLIARHDGRTANGEEVYRFDIIMAGDGETPFFDDLES